MTIPLWRLDKNLATQESHSADVTIIGGGFVGLSSAYWLSEMNPSLKIVILDRLQCGSGASSRNAGFLTKGSALFYQNLVKKWGEDKALAIHSFASESLNLMSEHLLMESSIDYAKAQSTTLMRSTLELNSLFGFKWQENLVEGFSGFKGSYQGSQEYRVQPLELIQLLKDELLYRGVKILEGQTAFNLSAQLVETSSSRVETQKVLLALNGYSAEFHPALAGLIKPYRAQMLAVEISGKHQLKTDLYYDPAERVYFRLTSDQRLIIGGKRLLDEKGEEGTFEKISTVIQKGLENYLSDTLKLSHQVVHRWSGIMGFTQHELPYVEKVEATTPTFIAAGFSGHGMGFGFHAAKEAAELMLEKRDRSFFSDFHQDKIRL